MLNEYKEVEAYLQDPNTDDIRLNAKLLTDNFKPGAKLNGIVDVLTLIACHYLYDFNKEKKLTHTMQANTILILRIWCGFAGDVTKEELEEAKAKNELWFKKYPQADGWLREYHCKHIAEQSNDWSTYSDKWSKSLNSKYLYRAEQLSYENILAQAIARGPLKNYYLCVAKDYDIVIKDGIKNDKGKSPDKRRQVTILKLLAAYMILRQLHPGQKYVLLQTNRILNWLGFESMKGDRWCLNFQWRGEPIFMQESHGDFLKFSVNQNFIKEMGIQLYDSTEGIDEKDYYIYQDDGAGKTKPLVKL